MTTEGYASGLVSIEEGNPPAAEYTPARKVRVEIGFAYDINGTPDEALDRAATLASTTIARLLGKAEETGEAASPPAPKRTRRTAAQIAADEAAKKAGTTAGSSSGAPLTGENTGGGNSAADPAAIGDGAAAIELPDQSKGGGDPAALDEWESPPQTETKPVTDADLNSAVQKKNAELNDPDAIRALIGSYNPDPTQVFQLRQIPAENRAEFLTKLAALTKAA